MSTDIVKVVNGYGAVQFEGTREEAEAFNLLNCFAIIEI